MGKKKKWLVTIQGRNSAMGHDSTRICSKIIKLDESKFSSPIEWFLLKPTVYFDFPLTVTALLNFWPIE